MQYSYPGILFFMYKSLRKHDSEYNEALFTFIIHINKIKICMSVHCSELKK